MVGDLVADEPQRLQLALAGEALKLGLRPVLRHGRPRELPESAPPSAFRDLADA